MNFQADFAQIFNEAPNPYVVMDTDFVIVGMNEAYLTATMRRREEILGRNMFEAFPSDPVSESGAMLRNSLKRVADTAQVDHLPLIPYPIAGPDGRLENRYWSASHIPIRSADGQLYILQHTVDVTELQRLRQLAEGRDLQVESDVLHRAGAVADRNRMLSQEGDYLRSLFAQAPSFMAVLREPRHIFHLANDAYLEIVGRTDIVGKTVAEALPEVVEQGFIQVLDQVYQSGEPFIAHGAAVILNRGPTGVAELRYLDFIYQPIKDDAGNVNGIFVQGHDVTQERVAQNRLQELAATLESRVEERTRELEGVQKVLRQSQKMEAVGNLAGGIAHDFNNLLQVITGSLQLVMKDSLSERNEKLLGNAMSAARRGAQLASQLLSYGRRQPLEPKVINPAQLVRGMDALLRRSIGEGIEVETIVSGGLWNTMADPTQVETALLNLAINARDAMDGHGKLTIELGNAYLDEDFTRRAEIQPGAYVMLSVSDTGQGIPGDVIEKVFEPFFSTKPEGKGTGLGLSMVYGFVRQSGGHVTITSEVGRGTTVRMYLPRCLAKEESLDETEAELVGGTETILVVEDDDAVRETVAAMLADLGYKILLARDADSGLVIVESGAHIDLLFTDVVMPGRLKSTDLAQKLAETRPGTAVLFTSGYTENSIVHEGRLDQGVNLLPKPYTREQLARKIRQLFDRRPAAAPAPEIVTFDSTASAGEQRPIKALFCEDEILIRMTAVEMLEELGVTVIETGSVAETLSALDDSFDVLICDMRLPDGNGLDLARAARDKFPQLPVLFATGDRMDMPFPKAALVGKPYDERMLRDALRAVGL